MAAITRSSIIRSAIAVAFSMALGVGLLIVLSEAADEPSTQKTRLMATEAGSQNVEALAGATASAGALPTPLETEPFPSSVRLRFVDRLSKRLLTPEKLDLSYDGHSLAIPIPVDLDQLRVRRGFDAWSVQFEGVSASGLTSDLAIAQIDADTLEVSYPHDSGLKITIDLSEFNHQVPALASFEIHRIPEVSGEFSERQKQNFSAILKASPMQYVNLMNRLSPEEKREAIPAMPLLSNGTIQTSTTFIPFAGELLVVGSYGSEPEQQVRVHAARGQWASVSISPVLRPVVEGVVYDEVGVMVPEADVVVICRTRIQQNETSPSARGHNQASLSAAFRDGTIIEERQSFGKTDSEGFFRIPVDFTDSVLVGVFHAGHERGFLMTQASSPKAPVRDLRFDLARESASTPYLQFEDAEGEPIGDFQFLMVEFFGDPDAQFPIQLQYPNLRASANGTAKLMGVPSGAYVKVAADRFDDMPELRLKSGRNLLKEKKR